MSTPSEKKRESNRRWAKENPEKQKEAINRWRKNNPDKVKEYELKGRDKKLTAQEKHRKTEKYRLNSRDYRYNREYGISLKIYNEMFEVQKGLCKICLSPETALNNKKELRTLSVDHCHKTGKVRGLLCHSCNMLLGKAKDNTMILKNAISYLEDTKGE